MLKLIKRIPFPVSIPGILLFLMVPALVLINSAKRGSVHSSLTNRDLYSLMSRLNLIQSFRGDISRQPPRIWIERLGLSLAKDLWKRQGSGIWWQGWAEDGNGYLLLPSYLWPHSTSKRLADIELGGIVAIGTDVLHRQQLLQIVESDSAQSIEISQPLTEFCLKKLINSTAVKWNPDGLSSLGGSLAPLLQVAREGCIALQLNGDQLHWHGVVGSRPMSSSPSNLRPKPLASLSSFSFSKESLMRPMLLSLSSTSSNLVFGNLLSRNIIKVPLETDYGLSRSAIQKLGNAPLNLSLISEQKGKYLASIQLQLLLRGGLSQWNSVMESLSNRLTSQGLTASDSSSLISKDNAISNVKVWVNTEQGKSNVVGGWFWKKDKIGFNLLQLSLGAAPNAEEDFSIPALTNDLSLRLLAEPRQLNKLGLLGDQWPVPLLMAKHLDLSLSPLQGSKPNANSWFWFKGKMSIGQLETP